MIPDDSRASAPTPAASARPHGGAPCSVIIARARPGSAPGACLAALEPQLGPDDEVVVVDDGGVDELPAWAGRVTVSGAHLTPDLWAAGLAEATREVVALTNSAMVPDARWLERARRVAVGPEVGVGGAIEPDVGLGVVDWAVYLVRYAPYMLPLTHTAGMEVPADNAAYQTAVLREYRPQWSDGFWEPFVHRAMRADGHRLAIDPQMIVRLAPGSAGASSFAHQRYSHGRMHGQLRSAGLSRGAVLGASLTAPAVPPLLVTRIVRRAWGKGRYRGRLVAALPFIVWFCTWWAAGELAGRFASIRARAQ